jgi:ubiquinone/menaquinone biosynthesis C-methylase UbiE
MSNILRRRRGLNPISLAIVVLLAAILSLLIYRTIPSNVPDTEHSEDWVQITSKSSLIHVGSNDSFATSQEGIQAGRLVLNYLEKKNLESAKKAIAIYKTIVPVENYGGEYTALQWFCEYGLAGESQKDKFITNKYIASFYDYFAANDFARLKEYLQRKYQLATLPDTGTQEAENSKAVLEDTILFNNPRREEWEKTSKVFSLMKIKEGQVIADVGSGPGYYSYQLAEKVGNKGKVYSIDTVQNHLDYIENVKKKYGITNIKTVHTDGENIGVTKNTVDLVFLCSLYHNIYGMNKEHNRDVFVNSIRDALKPDGTLFLVDNALVKDSQLPYHGPYVAKELIIGQLKYYGFRLVEQYQPIPQRYVLVFKKSEKLTASQS